MPALLVIAADEGVMPQTREHLAILDLLRVKSGLVALTKIDLVTDPEWLELVQLDVADLLSGTALAGAPILPVSARSGSGLPELLAELERLLAEDAPAAGPGPAASADRSRVHDLRVWHGRDRDVIWTVACRWAKRSRSCHGA